MGIMDLLETGIEGAETTNVAGISRPLTAAEMSQLSQAVSLKRIADALDGVMDYAHNAPAIRIRRD